MNEFNSVFRRYNGSKPYLHEFNTLHGGVSVKHGEYFIYPDGAWRSGEACYAPQSNPLDDAKSTIRYFKIALEQATEAFDYYKENTARHNAEDDAVVDTLKAMQREVRSIRKKLAAAEDEFLKVRVGASSVEEAKRIKEENERQRAEIEHDLAEKKRIALGRVRSIRI